MISLKPLRMREAEADWAVSSRYNLRLDPAQASHTATGWGTSCKWLLPALWGVTWGGVGKGLPGGAPASVFVSWVCLLALSLIGSGMRRRKEIHKWVGFGQGPSIVAIDIS